MAKVEIKAIILEVSTFDTLYPIDGREGEIIGLLLAEIDRMPNAPKVSLGINGINVTGAF